MLGTISIVPYWVPNKGNASGVLILSGLEHLDPQCMYLNLTGTYQSAQPQWESNCTLRLQDVSTTQVGGQVPG